MTEPFIKNKTNQQVILKHNHPKKGTCFVSLSPPLSLSLSCCVVIGIVGVSGTSPTMTSVQHCVWRSARWPWLPSIWPSAGGGDGAARRGPPSASCTEDSEDSPPQLVVSDWILTSCQLYRVSSLLLDFNLLSGLVVSDWILTPCGRIWLAVSYWILTSCQPYRVSS